MLSANPTTWTIRSIESYFAHAFVLIKNPNATAPLDCGLPHTRKERRFRGAPQTINKPREVSEGRSPLILDRKPATCAVVCVRISEKFFPYPSKRPQNGIAILQCSEGKTQQSGDSHFVDTLRSNAFAVLPILPKPSGPYRRRLGALRFLPILAL